VTHNLAGADLRKKPLCPNLNHSIPKVLKQKWNQWAMKIVSFSLSVELKLKEQFAHQTETSGQEAIRIQWTGIECR
jgi:hypothetical protein